MAGPPEGLAGEEATVGFETDSIKETFIAESSELLDEMERALLGLEKSPGDQDLLNSLFRAAHSIKGGSGMLGMGGVEKFTHVAENLLSKVRDRVIGMNGEIAGLLLECRDHVTELIELEARDQALPKEVLERDKALVGRLNALLGGTQKPAASNAVPAEAVPGKDTGGYGREVATGAYHISVKFGPDVLRDGMDPISFISYLSNMGEVVSLTTLFTKLPPTEEMDPETCYLGFEIDLRSDFDKKSLEDVFEFVSEGSFISILPPHSRLGSYIELISNSPEDSTLLGEILVKGGALTRVELEEALALQKAEAEAPETEEKKPLIGEILVSEGMVYPEMVDAALEKQKKALSVKSREASTIRIDAGKLDTLINLVGELVISSASVEQLAVRFRNAGLVESASVMTRLVEEIRDTTMRIRMVPIGDTLSRFNRVVRDIGRELGKEIDLEISGGDTELDKTVVDKINDPLMHLVRNAADHGIEKPEERKAAGKPPKGAISLNAYHDAGSIVIEVSDDGKGLNRKKILDKAVSAGLASPGQNLTDAEVYRLVFEPGFSTAENVTKLSGRGVGMDVVKRNIESLRGTVEVDCVEGRGTTVRIRLPLTLAIIDGFLVGVSDSRYVIPLDMVVECVELPACERADADRRNYINLRGEMLPFIRLRDYFGEGGHAGRFENMVVVQYAGQKLGLVVDELFGEVQTVIKSLGRAYREVKGVSGATIMGDGRVALILDIPRVIQSVEKIAAAAV